MMDRPRVARLRAKMLQALEVALAGENLAIVSNFGRFIPGREVRFQVTFKVNEGGTLTVADGDEGAADFLSTCHLYGFKKEDLGRLMILTGRGNKTLELTLSGINAKSRNDKMFIGKSADGATYRLKKRHVEEGFARAATQKTTPVPQRKPGQRKEDLILTDIRNVYMDLEPETLSEDGKLKGVFLDRKREALNAKLAALIIELGRQPTDADLEI